MFGTDGDINTLRTSAPQDKSLDTLSPTTDFALFYAEYLGETEPACRSNCEVLIFKIRGAGHFEQLDDGDGPLAKEVLQWFFGD